MEIVGIERAYWFWCPGCRHVHVFTVPKWGWNGSTLFPTVLGSLLHHYGPGEQRCHLAVSGGSLEFFDDCTHELKGKLVPMCEWSEDLGSFVPREENGSNP